MKTSSSDLPGLAHDHAAAAQLAEAAGDVLLALRDKGLVGTELKEAGDAASQRFLADSLAQQFPGDAVLSEEADDDARRLDAARVWIIDPLDGTREFSEPPREDWAVHVALISGGRLTSGAVSLPARGLTLSTGSAPSLPGSRGVSPRLVVSRTRPSAHAERVAEELDAELVPMGSAGAKAMAVVLGDADVYLHSGGQYEWDSAAPVAVAAAAGLHTSRLDGSELRYNQPDPWLPDLLICRPELAEQVIAIAGGQL